MEVPREGMWGTQMALVEPSRVRLVEPSRVRPALVAAWAAVSTGLDESR